MVDGRFVDLREQEEEKMKDGLGSISPCSIPGMSTHTMFYSWADSYVTCIMVRYLYNGINKEKLYI
jgi:hypothetical protein